MMMMMIIIIIIIIIVVVVEVVFVIPPYSRVHQMSWTSVFLGPSSSSPLRERKSLRGIFAGR